MNALLARAVAVAAACAVASPPAALASGTIGARGAVATDSRFASETGLRILRAGGNAVDAAVAIGYTLAVTYPSAGNLGGGGFMLLRVRDGTSHFIDFRETAPAAATATMYQDGHGGVVPEKSTVGPLSAGVPGTVAGLEYAREHFGRMSRSALLADAIRYASSGWTLDHADAAVFAGGSPLLARFEASAAIFTPGRTTLTEGDVLRQPMLAATLRAVETNGAPGFYGGPVARELTAASHAAGGILTPADLAGYSVKERTPLLCRHGEFEILTAPPPSSGGVAICEVLGMLEGTARHAYRSPADVQYEIEAERRAFADRSTALGDPDFVPSPVDKLLAPAYLQQHRATIDPMRATPSSAIHGLTTTEGTNTTNYSVVDLDGNAVDVTYTLNAAFGSGFVAGTTGVLLNDEMDDFAAAPGVPNQFGLVQGAANAIAPKKRPLSSMSPTIVVDKAGRPRIVAGAAGGPRIITAVLDIMRAVVDGGQTLDEAVQAPRLHQQWLPDVVNEEPHALDATTQARLSSMGYRFKESRVLSSANAVGVLPDGRRVAAHDDRRPTGSGLAY